MRRLITLSSNLNLSCCVQTHKRLGIFLLPAEDGIRDHCVTGVQTCALPIFMLAGVVTNSRFPEQWGTQNASVDFFRSEERRVRTECRSACVLYARQHKN